MEGVEVRSATIEEEKWLDTQEQQSLAEGQWLAMQAESLEGRRAGISLGAVQEAEVAAIPEEAESFNRDQELELWVKAQHEALCVVEAENLKALEEARNEEVQEVSDVEESRSHHMMRVLQDGARYLVHKELAENESYQELLNVQRCAQELLEIVDRGMTLAVERERRAAIQHAAAATERLREVEAIAEEERILFKTQIARYRQEQAALREELESEKDRTTCRICFARPRDVLPLPCMHFDYCSVCLDEHRRRRKTCPTCRSPISGVLHYNLRIG